MTEGNDPFANDPLGTSNPQPKAGKPKEKVEKLADEAVEAGNPILESEIGRKAVDVADTVFDKAGQLADKALGTEIGRKVAHTADEWTAKAVESETGRKALGSEAGQTARKVWNTPVGRNVGTGAAVGAGIGLIIPFGGPLIGAVIGGGLGYLRTLAKKSKAD